MQRDPILFFDEFGWMCAWDSQKLLKSQLESAAQQYDGCVREIATTTAHSVILKLKHGV